MKEAVRRLRVEGRTIGLVPTMGFLHEGHLSLVRECRRSADVTVVSIFVNPLQFGPREDLAAYPRDIERDAGLLERKDVDILFAPEAGDMYPEGYQTTVDVPRLSRNLCGSSRPGHFKGVATVVLKLFNIIRPDLAFFGQKDAQQAAVLKRMAADLNLDVEVRVLPIVRETDGLAMSSRNVYLTPRERAAAVVLSRALAEAGQLFDRGERRAEVLIARVRTLIEREPSGRLDYVEVVGVSDLAPLEKIDRDALVALAVYFGRTRLIDNIVLEMKGKQK